MFEIDGEPMDRRIEKTRASIINTFLELRASKDLERITVKELCEKADINKSTFYAHFRDIYALSEELESQLAEDMIKGLSPLDPFREPERFTEGLYYACISHGSLIKILFSGSRSGLLVERFEESIKKGIESLYPGLLEDPLVSTLLTLEIYGEYNAFMKCRHFGDSKVISILSSHWKHSLEMLGTTSGEEKA